MIKNISPLIILSKEIDKSTEVQILDFQKSSGAEASTSRSSNFELQENTIIDVQKYKKETPRSTKNELQEVQELDGNYIDINYSYLIKFNKIMSGSYTYYIKGIVSANKPNGEDGFYWQKEYLLIFYPQQFLSVRWFSGIFYQPQPYLAPLFYSVLEQLPQAPWLNLAP